MREFDILIIGAGIAGASLAWRLAARRSVLLVERESQPGYHATGRSAAMFMETYGAPGVRALTRASRAFYERPPPGFGEQPLLWPRGVMYLATEGQQGLLQQTRQDLSRDGAELQVLGAEETTARVPCLRAGVVQSALWDGAAQDIDVHALHQGFLRGFRQQGGELRCATAPRAVRHDGQCWEVELNGGEAVRARQVVNAAGAWADQLAGLFGAAPIGLEPRRRSAFTFKAPEGMDVSGWPAVVGIDESYYFKPDAGRLLGSPANADPTVPHDVVPEELDIAMGIHAIEAVTTLTIRRPASTWAGLRSFVADGELVIGLDERSPGFLWLAAQGGYGIQSAAGASELAASLLCGEPLPGTLAAHGVDPRTFAPQRLRPPA